MFKVDYLWHFNLHLAELCMDSDFGEETGLFFWQDAEIKGFLRKGNSVDIGRNPLCHPFKTCRVSREDLFHYFLDGLYVYRSLVEKVAQSFLPSGTLGSAISGLPFSSIVYLRSPSICSSLRKRL